MANYVKSTNFAGKDSLPTGDPLKVVKGTEIDVEFNAIATAVASKADLASPTFTGTPYAPTASPGTSTTQIATTAFVGAAVTAATGALGTMSTQNSNNVTITGGTVAATLTGNLTGNVTGNVTGNLTGNVTGNVTGSAGTAGNALGVGQTIQNVTSSRSLGTTYTNSTGRTIFVMAEVYYEYDQTEVGYIIDGVTIYSGRIYSGGGVFVRMDVPLSFPVPAGSTYRITGNTLRTWFELR